MEGLLIGDSRASTRERVKANTGLNVQLGSISAEGAGLVAEKLGYTATPFALVLDRDGRVAGSYPAGQNVPPETLARLVSGS